jgi:co-chaperonin GroES (HSP10)
VSIDKVIQVKGYKVLIAVPEKKEKAGSVYLPDSHVDRESTAGICGNVVALGPEAYKDEDKFPSGPRCEVGDWVMFASFSGRRFKVKGQEFRMVNDDTIDAVVSDPRLIERV